MDVKILKAVFAYSGFSQAAIARGMGMTAANFGQRLSRGSFNDKELAKIGEIIGAEFHPAKFVFHDGREF